MVKCAIRKYCYTTWQYFNTHSMFISSRIVSIQIPFNSSFIIHQIPIYFIYCISIYCFYSLVPCSICRYVINFYSIYLPMVKNSFYWTCNICWKSITYTILIIIFTCLTIPRTIITISGICQIPINFIMFASPYCFCCYITFCSRCYIK